MKKSSRLLRCVIYYTLQAGRTVVATVYDVRELLNPQVFHPTSPSNSRHHNKVVQKK